MEAKDLRKWRFLIPGMIAFAAVLLILLADARKDEVASLSPSQFALIIPLLLSVLYSVLDIRKVFAPDLFGEVNRNISLRLFALRDTQVVPASDLPRLQDQNRLINLFWKIVDGEKSLEKKSQGVMHNGLFVTSLLDAFVVLLLTAPFGVAYGYWRAIERGEFQLSTVFVAGAICAVALFCRFILLPSAQKKHLELSNEQLDYIEQHLRTQVSQGISGLWYGLSQTP